MFIEALILAVVFFALVAAGIKDAIDNNRRTRK